MNDIDRMVADFIRKGEKLFEEAEKDLRIGAYNKAVSAYYFAVECYANALMLKKKQKARGFSSRKGVLASIISREIARKFDYLYQLRVKADHHADLLNEADALRAKDIALEIISSIKKYLQMQ